GAVGSVMRGRPRESARDSRLRARQERSEKPAGGLARGCADTRPALGEAAPGPDGTGSATSALAVLGRLARLLEAGLLALLDPRVAGQEAGLLERGPVRVDVDLVESAGHAQAKRAGLTRDAATVDA